MLNFQFGKENSPQEGWLADLITCSFIGRALVFLVLLANLVRINSWTTWIQSLFLIPLLYLALKVWGQTWAQERKSTLSAGKIKITWTGILLLACLLAGAVFKADLLILGSGVVLIGLMAPLAVRLHLP